jgi:hypothetical protein
MARHGRRRNPADRGAEAAMTNAEREEMMDYNEFEHGSTLDRIETLIKQGAQVRLGKRRMHVIHKDGKGGMVKLECDIAAWEAYKTSGIRPVPQTVQNGLR